MSSTAVGSDARVANQSIKETVRKVFARRPQSVKIRQRNTRPASFLTRSRSLDNEKYSDQSRNENKMIENNVEKSEQKEKRSFLKQFFDLNNSARYGMNEALWTVFSMTDGITQNCLAPDKQLHTYKQKNIPQILINGIPYQEIFFNKHESPVPKKPECAVEGDGLKEGIVDLENTFYIQTNERFNKSHLHISIKGPKQKPVKIDTVMVDVNVCKFTYWPRRVGYYTINIQWKMRHVNGSPFDVWIT